MIYGVGDSKLKQYFLSCDSANPECGRGQAFAGGATASVESVAGEQLGERRVGIGSFASGRVPDKRGRQQVVNGLRNAVIQPVVVARGKRLDARPFPGCGAQIFDGGVWLAGRQVVSRLLCKRDHRFH